MGFVTDLPLSTNEKKDNYDIFFDIMEQHSKIIHHKSIKTTIDTIDLTRIIINMIIRHYYLSESNAGD